MAVGSAAGTFVSDAPEPLNVVAVQIPDTFTPVLDIINLSVLTTLNLCSPIAPLDTLPA